MTSMITVPKFPLLTILTRTYKRPKALAVLQASLARQSCKDFEHVIIRDEIGIGIEQTHINLRSQSAEGDYVWVLDDDEEVVDWRFVEWLWRSSKSLYKPRLIVAPYTRHYPGAGTQFLPDAWPPKRDHIASNNIIVDHALWYSTRESWGTSYSGDFDWIAEVWKQVPSAQFYLGTVVVSQTVSLGAPE